MNHRPSDPSDVPRRRALAWAGSLVAAVGGCAARASLTRPTAPLAAPPDVTPLEALMREHGVLGRVLLVYEAAAERLERSQDLDPSQLHRAADVARAFVEDYHVDLEERWLFPRFDAAGRQPALLAVLRAQHARGRAMTDVLLAATAGGRPLDAPARRDVARTARAYVRMLREHSAREDTDLFPGLRAIVSHATFDALGEDFARDERRRFGRDGFDAIVDRVARIEAALGIADLAAFTPPPG